MKIKLRAHLIATIAVLLYALAYTGIVIRVSGIDKLFHQKFFIVSLIGIIPLIIIINFLMRTQTKHFRTDIPELRNNLDGYKEYLGNLGSVPLKCLIFILFLEIIYMVVINNLMKAEGAPSNLLNSLAGYSIGIALLSSSFIYVLYDKLVSITLINNGINDYPDGLKSNRQHVKGIIIPSFVCIMTTIATTFLVAMVMNNIPEGTTDITGYVTKEAFPALIGFMIITIALILLWSKNTTMLFTNVISTLNVMASNDKDLTNTITVASVDELGLISHLVNSFSDIISVHMNETKKMSDLQSANQEELFDSISAVSTTMSESVERLTSIIEISQNNDERVKSTLETGRMLIENSSSVADQVDIQTNNMAESSAAVEEMIASVNEVAKRTVVVKERTEELAMNFNEGQNKINETITSVSNVSELSKSLMDINKIIAGIASRTNLLAMNAAIEAAHAGEAGKGFSVVADEIRKLAENTSAQTKSSTENLKQIIDEISSSMSIAKETGDSFDKMKEGLHIVENETYSISVAMVEHDKANNEVLEQLTNTNSLAIKLNEISSKLNDQGNIMLENLEQLETSSQTLLSNSMETKENANDVVRALSGLNERSKVAEENQKKVRDLANSFKLD